VCEAVGPCCRPEIGFLDEIFKSNSDILPRSSESSTSARASSRAAHDQGALCLALRRQQTRCPKDDALGAVFDRFFPLVAIDVENLDSFNFHGLVERGPARRGGRPGAALRRGRRRRTPARDAPEVPRPRSGCPSSCDSPRTSGAATRARLSDRSEGVHGERRASSSCSNVRGERTMTGGSRAHGRRTSSMLRHVWTARSRSRSSE